MSINPLNAISKVYLEQVAVDEAKQPFPAKKVAKQMEKARKGSVYGKPFSNEPTPNVSDAEKKETRRYSKMFHASEKAKREKQEADKARRSPTFYKDTHPTSAPKMKKANEEYELGEALDPVGQEDADIDNDGKKNTKSDKYLLNRRKAIGKAISTQKEAVDQDGDGDNDFADVMIARMTASGKKSKKQAITATKNKSYNKESFSNWREELKEIVDVVTKEQNPEQIKEKKVNNKIKINPTLNTEMVGTFKESVENLGGTLIEMVEVDEVDYIVESVYDELIIEGYEKDDIEEAIEYALTEAKVTFGHDTPVERKRDKLLAAAKSKLSGVKTAAKAAVAKGARKVAKGALGVARKMEGGDKTPSTSHTKTRTASTYRGAGVGTKEKVSSGSYTPPAKKKAEKPADPWEGSATTPPKAKAKKAAPKRKRKSKLDDLLASVRNESIQIDEKTLTSSETKKKEEIVKSMKDKSADFEKRYPGRGKEVMYATATKIAKKVAEQAMELQPKTQQPTSNPQQPQQQKKVQQQQDRMRQQEVQILQKKLQTLRSAPKGTDPSITT